MKDSTGPRLRRWLRVLAGGAAAGLLAATLATAATPAAARDSAPPQPDFTHDDCIVDILAYTCPFHGTVVGGSEIVRWEWIGIGGLGGSQLPSAPDVIARPNHVPQTVYVTLRVTDADDRTGSITRRVRLELSDW